MSRSMYASDEDLDAIKYKILGGEVVPSVLIEDICLTVSVHEDTLILEQPGDHAEGDIIMVYGRHQGEKIVDAIQKWINYKYPRINRDNPYDE